jgi:hypothetical protein
MNKQKEFEKWGLKKLEKIQKILLLDDHYPVTLTKKVLSKNSRAEASFNYPYKSIDVYYNDEMLKDFTDKKYQEVINTLVHEICHSLTDPLYSKAYERFISKNELEDERERLTDHIANIIIKNKLI